MIAGSRTYALGIIVPTREEFDYLSSSIPVTPLPDDESGFWYEFGIPGGRRAVVRVLFDMGLTPTTAVTLSLLQRFHPEILVVVGIGGALDDDLRLGDVVVASAVHEYLKAAKATKHADGNTAFESAGDSWPLGKRLRGFAENFPYYSKSLYQAWIAMAKERSFTAGLALVTTYGARQEPKFFVMHMASGDLVVTDPTFRTWVLSHDRKQGAIDMESAGAARAVAEFDGDVTLLVLRGISDFANERKTDLDGAAFGRQSGAWRRYAVQNAAELLLAFLASPRFPWRSPAPVAPAEPVSAVAPDGSAERRHRAWEYFKQASQWAAAGGEAVHHWYHKHGGPAGTHANGPIDHPYAADAGHTDQSGHGTPEHHGPGDSHSYPPVGGIDPYA